LTTSTKMHTLGHDSSDADTYYALTEDEIQSLAVTEHNRWSVERLITGSRPCTDGEREEIRKDRKLKPVYKKKNIHYDLCAFDELGIDDKGRNAQDYDHNLIVCIPLMVKTFYEENHGERK